MLKLSDLLGIIQSHWILSLIILVATLVYVHFIIYFGEIRKLGLPGPKPVPILGNLIDLFRDQGQMHKTVDRFVKQYGRVFGMYFMKTPAVVVSDLQIIKEIMIKEFSSFHDRPTGGLELPEPLASMLTVVTGERWKNIRTILTPAFTTGKLKDIMSLMNTVADTFLTKCEAAASSGETVDIYKWFESVTMETILTSAFGVEAETQTNPNDPVTKAAKKILNINPLVNIVGMLPLIGAKLAKRIILSDAADIRKIAEQIIRERKKHGIENDTRMDILHKMLATQVSDGKGHKLTDSEIVGQNIVFLQAGSETSSITLGFTSYHLAIYPEVQDKLQEEIDRICPGDVIDYQSLQGMVYLDAVISETLRVFPPLFIIARSVTKPCEVSGIKLKENMAVFIPVYTLHHDETYWKDPEAFKPERFMPENKDEINQLAYMPFGQGPRNCIGMRFALLEIKLVLARMLKKFRIERAPELNVPISVKQKNLMVPGDPLYIRLKKRE